jgi:type I restriction enzyme, S subunit
MSLALENRTRIGKLGDVLVFRNDIVHPRDNPRGGATFVGLEHIERDTGVRIGSEAIKLEEMSGRRSRFKKGDIVYGYLRPYLNKVWIADLDGICSVDQYVFQVTPKNDLSYIAHYLRSEIFLKTAPIDGTPGQLPRIRSGEITATPIPLPPLAEQRRIAAILDAADALRQQRRQALRLLDQLSQSIFLDMFGDLAINGKWPVSEFGDLVSDTKLGLVRGSEQCSPGLAHRYLRMNAISRDGELDLSNVWYTSATEAEVREHNLQRGDFLFNTRNSRELVGKTALFREEDSCLFNNNILRARFNTKRVDPEYMAAAFKSSLLQRELDMRKAGTTSVFAIYWKSLATMPVPVPPLHMQTKFAAIVGAKQLAKINFQQSSQHLDTLFAALQHRAFRGEL